MSSETGCPRHWMRVERSEEPDRGDLQQPGIEWRHGGPPNYTLANKAFLDGKTQNHAPDSMERIIEDFVKTWEMEASHKTNIQQWTTINLNDYQVQSNGGPWFPGDFVKEIGNYNALLNGCKAYESMKNLTFEESHELFQGAFNSVFPWELLKLLQVQEVDGGKGLMADFSWRHWGQFNGKYKGHQGTGETIELFGVTRVKLGKKGTDKDDDEVKDKIEKEWKLEKLQVYFDGDAFLDTLSGKRYPEKVNVEKYLKSLYEKAKAAWNENN